MWTSSISSRSRTAPIRWSLRQTPTRCRVGVGGSVVSKVSQRIESVLYHRRPGADRVDNGPSTELISVIMNSDPGRALRRRTEILRLVRGRPVRSQEELQALLRRRHHYDVIAVLL